MPARKEDLPGTIEPHGGIDASKSKQDLYEDAKEAGIEGRSGMRKEELAAALQKHSERESARARR